MDMHEHITTEDRSQHSVIPVYSSMGQNKREGVKPCSHFNMQTSVSKTFEISTFSSRSNAINIQQLLSIYLEV